MCVCVLGVCWGAGVCTCGVYVCVGVVCGGCWRGLIHSFYQNLKKVFLILKKMIRTVASKINTQLVYLLVS